MEYKIEDKVYNAIDTFYENVAIRYCNTNSEEDILNYIRKAYRSIYQIENGLPRRRPRMKRWRGYHVALSKDGTWYYAYRIEGNIIHVYDVCYCTNIHDNREIIDSLVVETINEIKRQLLALTKQPNI